MRRLASVLIVAACALGSCGGGDDQESVEDILDQAFRQEVDSADLSVDAGLDLRGGAWSGRPVRIEASGPVRINAGGLPSVDIDLRVGSEGAGQTIETGFLSTGERAFVKFQDVFYEQPLAEVRRANRAIAGNHDRRGSLEALGLEPRSWLGRATEEGGDEIGGVPTRHLSGTLRVEAVMRNLNEFVRRSGPAIGGATLQAVPQTLRDEDIARVGQIVKDSSFDIYVGRDDDVIRRVSGRVELEVPENARQRLGGLESGTLTFSIEMGDVNGDQEIEAPAKARPLSALTDSLGSGALGLYGDVPVAPDDLDPPDAGGDGSGESTPETEALREYSECLDRAPPEDTEALQSCADLLQP